jgi:hypothetical protein
LWLAELQEQILCLLCMLILIYFSFLLKFIHVLKGDLTLGVISSIYVACCYSHYFSSSILSSLLVVSLSGSRLIVLALDLHFGSVRSSLPEHIRPSYFDSFKLSKFHI